MLNEHRLRAAHLDLGLLLKMGRLGLGLLDLLAENLLVLFLLNSSLVQTTLDVPLPKNITSEKHANPDDAENNVDGEPLGELRSLSDRPDDDVPPGEECPANCHL